MTQAHAIADWAARRRAAGEFPEPAGKIAMLLVVPEFVRMRQVAGNHAEADERKQRAIKPSDLSYTPIPADDGTVGGICARLDACFRQPTPPTALLVSRPPHVLTVLGHLMRRGLRLPHDVALISRDDDAFLEHVVPSVARYASNPSAFAQKLSKLVLEVASGGALVAADHRIMPHFVRGETFG